MTNLFKIEKKQATDWKASTKSPCFFKDIALSQHGKFKCFVGKSKFNDLSYGNVTISFEGETSEMIMARIDAIIEFIRRESESTIVEIPFTRNANTTEKAKPAAESVVGSDGHIAGGE